MRYLLLIFLVFSVVFIVFSIPFTQNRSRIVVQWNTGSEFNTAGFNVYRSDSPAGPFFKINAQLIPAAPDPVSGGRYEFVDTEVAPGKTYYYQLEDVEYSGAATRHGPITATSSNFADWQAGAIGLGLVLIGLLFFFRRRVTVVHSSNSMDEKKAELDNA